MNYVLQAFYSDFIFDASLKLKTNPMKQFFFSVAAIATLALFSADANAKIWRLNNSNGNTLTPAINANFTGTLQEAHDNASVNNGDTIHIEASTVSYGSLTMTKRLVLIGPGYFLDQNPKTQVNRSYGSTIGALTILNPASAGSFISGLTINGAVVLGANKLVLFRNYISLPNYNYIYLGTGNATNIDSIVIRSNYIDGAYPSPSVQGYPSTTGNVTNFIFSNNIISNAYNTWCISLGGNVSGTIRNNVFIGPSPMSVYNMYVVNNIQTFSSNAGANQFFNSVVEFNLGRTAAFFQTPTGTNNTISNNIVNTTPGFVATGSPDGYYQLAASSPAKGTGRLGQDMGAFGGQIPYALSGLPWVPNIYSLTIAPIAPGATSISVTVSAKSN